MFFTYLISPKDNKEDLFFICLTSRTVTTERGTGNVITFYFKPHSLWLYNKNPNEEELFSLTRSHSDESSYPQAVKASGSKFWKTLFPPSPRDEALSALREGMVTQEDLATEKTLAFVMKWLQKYTSTIISQKGSGSISCPYLHKDPNHFGLHAHLNESHIRHLHIKYHFSFTAKDLDFLLKNLSSELAKIKSPAIIKNLDETFENIVEQFKEYQKRKKTLDFNYTTSNYVQILKGLESLPSKSNSTIVRHAQCLPTYVNESKFVCTRAIGESETQGQINLGLLLPLLSTSLLVFLGIMYLWKSSRRKENQPILADEKSPVFHRSFINEFGKQKPQESKEYIGSKEAEYQETIDSVYFKPKHGEVSQVSATASSLRTRAENPSIRASM